MKGPAALQVFTTCGSRAKREALLGMFPALAEDHIGNSRDTSFEGMVRTLTDGAGVDIVLNSLAGDKLQVGHVAFVTRINVCLLVVLSII